MPTATKPPVVNTEVWNGAHHALIRARIAKAESLKEWEAEVDSARATLAVKLRNRDSIAREVEEIEYAILNSGFVPKDGYDIWGQRTETTDDLDEDQG